MAIVFWVARSARRCGRAGRASGAAPHVLVDDTTAALDALGRARAIAPERA
jgi:hypothetical protein